MSVELAEVTNAVAEFDRVAAGLAALREKYQGVIYDVTTTGGMKDAKEARLAVREPRFEVERIRKAAKAPILALGKKLDSEAARITAELLKIEEPIDTVIKAEEARKEAEKQAKIEAEMRRVADLQERVAELRGNRALSSHSGSGLIAGHVADLEKILVDDSFQEFRQQAEDAKASGLSWLRELHAAALAHEAEQKRILAEREELARLRAEQAEREAQDRARRAAEDRAAQQAREAEARKQAEELARQREEQERAAQAERDRLAEEQRRLDAARAEIERDAREQREAQEAEERRIAAERAELERQQREAREAEELRQREAERLARERREREEAAAAAERKRLERRKLMESRSRPDSESIVQVVAESFDVDPDIAAAWLYETPKTAWKNLAKREAA